MFRNFGKGAILTVIKINKATSKQIQYIEQLAIDLNLDRYRRNRHIVSIICREIKFLDELRRNEASAVIDKFKYWKENEKDVTHYEEEK